MDKIEPIPGERSDRRQFLKRSATTAASAGAALYATPSIVTARAAGGISPPLAPTVTSVCPTSFSEGDGVVICGSNFGVRKQNLLIFVEGTGGTTLKATQVALGKRIIARVGGIDTNLSGSLVRVVRGVGVERPDNDYPSSVNVESTASRSVSFVGSLSGNGGNVTQSSGGDVTEGTFDLGTQTLTFNIGGATWPSSAEADVSANMENAAGWCGVRFRWKINGALGAQTCVVNLGEQLQNLADFHGCLVVTYDQIAGKVFVTTAGATNGFGFVSVNPPGPGPISCEDLVC